MAKAAAKKRDTPWIDAIEAVLKAAREPLHYTEIADRVVADGLRRKVGATPAASVASYLSTSLKTDPNTPFVRVSRGYFTLKASGAPAKQKPGTAAAVEAPTDEESQYDVISSFGMFWRRGEIEWKAAPKLLGAQSIGSTPVDFSGQLGIYLLYDGREVIYVGRSTERPLGRRLYEHTQDRLSGRWDRFSWFGFLPVSESGKLGKMPSEFDASKVLPALEAVLIEAVEPRQNRKRGDDLAAVEYLQAEDPQIAKKRAKAVMEAALDKL